MAETTDETWGADIAGFGKLKATIATLTAERDEARQIVRDTHWMARRYADGRMSYAVSMFNDAVRKAFDAGWLEWKNEEPRYASDGMFSAEWVSQADHIAAPTAENARLQAEVDAMRADREALRLMHRRAQKAEGRLSRIDQVLAWWDKHLPKFIKDGIMREMAFHYFTSVQREARRGATQEKPA